METTQYGSISPEGIEAMKHTDKTIDAKFFHLWASNHGWLKFNNTKSNIDNSNFYHEMWVTPQGSIVRVNYLDDRVTAITT